MSPAQGARAGGEDLQHPEFPAHFTDNTGVSLQLCEDGSLNCHEATETDLAPPLGEALYYSAAATVASGANNLSIEFALEALFDEE
ncbi:MAG TPA: hypothetical protein VF728_11025, partial [Nocardioides sp.]